MIKQDQKQFGMTSHYEKLVFYDRCMVEISHPFLRLLKQLHVFVGYLISTFDQYILCILFVVVLH